MYMKQPCISVDTAINNLLNVWQSATLKVNVFSIEIIDAAHFNNYEMELINGNICKYLNNVSSTLNYLIK